MFDQIYLICDNLSPICQFKNKIKKFKLRPTITIGFNINSLLNISEANSW